MISAFAQWANSLSVNYGVNPYLFASIYIGAIPFFFASGAWIIHNRKHGHSVIIPVAAMLTCAISSYIYLLIAGRNVPIWVYFIIVAVLILAIYSALQKVRSLSSSKKSELTNKAATENYDFIVIGGGSAGLVAAGGAGLLGLKVALIEKHRLGGDCLYTGCVPSKALIQCAQVAYELQTAERFGFNKVSPEFSNSSFKSVIARVQNVISEVETRDAPSVFEEMGVEVVFGKARFLSESELELQTNNGEHRILSAKRFCISTGSSPAVPPIVGLKEVGFLTTDTVFNIESLPSSLAIIGGGPIGVEIGQAFARLGSRVVIIEKGSRLLSREEPEASVVISSQLQSEGVEIRTGCTVSRISNDPFGLKRLQLETGSGHEFLVVKEILIASGRKPNIESLDLLKAKVRFDDKKIETDRHLQTTNRRIFAAGDVTGHFAFTHMADYEAQVVLQNVLLPPWLSKSANYDVVPWTTFCDPEVAHVGLTEEQARRKYGSRIQIATSEFATNDRAVATGKEKGFAKIITRAIFFGLSTRIVGATIVGPSAGELITEFTLAMSLKLSLGRLGQAVRVYPTYSKIVQAINLEGTMKQLKNPKVQSAMRIYLKFWRRL